MIIYKADELKEIKTFDLNEEYIKLLSLLERINPLKEYDDRLCFLFGGFNKDEVIKYDLYYNMLLKIIEAGIDKKAHTIEFGQTAEESKLKIGCKEVYKYLYVHHSNAIINFIIQKLLPVMSYRPYKTIHRVFKE